LEEALVFLSRSPPGPAVTTATHGAIRLLYNDLPHPPSTNMGEYWQFRSADGSGNSRLEPDMGKAGTPYSRSCASTRALSEAELPDPGLVFDLLIKRDGFKPHPAGLAGLFFNYATTVIHSVFRTSRTDWNINETSSYVDMGILYGNTQAHQDKMRVVDGRGKILPDCFAETRLVNLPPGVTALIIIFNRNHNWIADMLLSINERGLWNQDIAEVQAGDPELLKKQDYEIFNTARLINSLTYANVVLGDYLAAILGTVRDLSSWTLDISSEYRETNHSLLERGTGNSCSVEFNTLYRLHPAMSQDDEKFTEGQFQWLFGSADWDSLTPDTFEATLLLYEVDAAPRDYLKVPWGRNQRDPTTYRYSDDVLAQALQQATSVPAAAFKARGVPHVMRVIEILGIEQARNWGCCSLNDFRRFLGLKPYSTFEEWNPDPKIADAARKLYRNPENLELYVGLVAEQSKDVGPGAGLCPSYTAILADAVALVRGDRYLTYDCTPFNLTPFGFTEGNRNVNNAAYGGMLGRILHRALPNHYNATSVYTHFPLVTPTGQKYSMDNVLKTNGVLDRYTIERPTPQLPVKLITDAQAITDVVGIAGPGYVTLYAKNITDIKLNKGFLAVVDDPVSFGKATTLLKQLITPTPDDLKKTFTWFHDRALALVRDKSLTLADPSKHTVDLVKDIFRLLPVHWSSSQVAGLPLKSTFDPSGIFFEQQMFLMLREIYTYIYTEPENSLKIPLKVKAAESVERLMRFIQYSVTEIKGGVIAGILSAAEHFIRGNKTEYNNAILKRFAGLNSPVPETASDILGLIATASVELSQSESIKHIDFLQKALQDKIIALSASYSTDSLILLMGYVREALRLDPAVPGIYRKTKAISTLAGNNLDKDQRVYLDLAAIGQNEAAFASPANVDPNRPATAYSLLQADGVFKILGEEFVYGTAATTLQAVFSLKNVRRAGGKTGTLRRYVFSQSYRDISGTS
ncbi:heme peroxidase, partial [Clavulina sp. PMI_390]